jgi:translation initiation factor 1
MTGATMAGRQKRDSALVYSTDSGRRCPQCARPVADCVCGKDRPAATGDGILRIQRETKGRGGKAVTVVRGLPLSGAELKALAKTLKQRCGVGGAVKEGNIEIQGDQRQILKTELEKQGFKVKLAGG